MFLIVGFLFHSCTRDSIVENSNTNATISENVLEPQTQKGNETKVNVGVEHNIRIKNIINKLESRLNSNQKISNEEFIQVFDEEFSQELLSLKDNKYYALFQNPIRFRKVSMSIVAAIFYDEDSRIYNDSLAFELYNEILSKIPKSVILEIKGLSNNLLDGALNPSNIDIEFANHEQLLLPNNNFSPTMVTAIKATFKTMKHSYLLWLSVDEGGEGYASKYMRIRNKIEYYETSSTLRMCDNCWPPEATTPKWVDNDLIGAAAGGIQGGWEGALIWGVASSLMT